MTVVDTQTSIVPAVTTGSPHMSMMKGLGGWLIIITKVRG